MKFSGSLLEMGDIAEGIFKNSTQKSKALLTSIFGIAFNNIDKGILEVREDINNLKFDATFKLNGRIIEAELRYESDDITSNIVSEVLIIKEKKEEKIVLNNIMGFENEKERYDEYVREVQNYLEERFEISFTPLDLNENDKNILAVEFNKEGLEWGTCFLQEHHEGNFEAYFKLSKNIEQFLILVSNYQHKIYLD